MSLDLDASISYLTDQCKNGENADELSGFVQDLVVSLRQGRSEVVTAITKSLAKASHNKPANKSRIGVVDLSQTIIDVAVHPVTFWTHNPLQSCDLSPTPLSILKLSRAIDDKVHMNGVATSIYIMAFARCIARFRAIVQTQLDRHANHTLVTEEVYKQLGLKKTQQNALRWKEGYGVLFIQHPYLVAFIKPTRANYNQKMIQNIDVSSFVHQQTSQQLRSLSSAVTRLEDEFYRILSMESVNVVHENQFQAYPEYEVNPCDVAGFGNLEICSANDLHQDTFSVTWDNIEPRTSFPMNQAVYPI